MSWIEKIAVSPLTEYTPSGRTKLIVHELRGNFKIKCLNLHNLPKISGSIFAYGKLVGKTWEQNKALDSGTNPVAVEAIISKIQAYALGYKLPGAGGGGYLYIVAKDPGAALQIRKILTLSPPNSNARFVEMSLSNKGLQISRS